MTIRCPHCAREHLPYCDGPTWVPCECGAVYTDCGWSEPASRAKAAALAGVEKERQAFCDVIGRLHEATRP